MTRADPYARRPEAGRFVSDQHYWRPQWHVYELWFIPREVRTAALYGVAWCATTILVGIRIWRHLTEHDDEIGD